MLAEFISWWAGQLTDLARHGLRTTAGATACPTLADALLVQCHPDAADGSGEIELVQRRRGRLMPLGRFGTHPKGLAEARRCLQARRRPGPLVLAPAGQTVLSRGVTLPLAAERGLRTVLRFEMDRLTPFRSEDVAWDCRMLRRDTGRGLLDVELALVPIQSQAPLLAALRAAGLAPVALEARQPDGRMRRIPMTEADEDPTARTWQRLGAAACAALALAVLLTPLLRQSLALNQAEAQITALRPRMETVDALRRRLSGADAPGAAAAARAQAGATLQALATLTDLLPDDTFLTALSLQHGRLRLEGQSAAAARLIGALADEPRIRNAAFAAPLVRGDAGKDAFAIEAEFAP
ncbi:PilN domain-containing protein [Rhodovastum atsumiense]|uniref:PilN domain-containing protein n=1 Tax=Rhodovastum atsumiense TaxID=504468 RepID=UPI00139F2B40|nr:PilN domain-containing protein [Rhodovastum atsumiense]